MPQIVIIGAGLAGISAGYHAEQNKIDYKIYEQHNRVGGLCRTIEKEGFYFDYSGHLLHLKDSYIQSLVRDLLKGRLNIIQRKAFIYSHGVFTRYPFQANLSGLPHNVLKECLLGFVEAYCNNRNLNSRIYKNFHDWAMAKFGEGIGKYFMFPFNEKLWTVSAAELTCDWISEYVPTPTIEDVFDGAFGDPKKVYGYNSTFWYPKTGGIQALCDAFAKKVPNIILSQKVIAVDPTRKVIEFGSGKKAKYDRLVSTIPLKNLIEKIIGDVPNKIKEAGHRLRHNSVIIINLGIRGEIFGDKHWIYIPEKKFTPYRVGVYSNFSKYMSPPGNTSLYAEIAYQKDWKIDKEKMVEKAIDEMVEMGFISQKEDILTKEVFDIEYGYVIYDKNYAKSRKAVIDYLNRHEIYSIGRYGNWEYSGMEESILQGSNILKILECKKSF